MLLFGWSGQNYLQDAGTARRGGDRAADEQGVPGAEPRILLHRVLQPRLCAAGQERAVGAHIHVRSMTLSVDT